MFLVLVNWNGERVGDLRWGLNEAKAALKALEVCGFNAHLAVTTVRSNANEAFFLSHHNSTKVPSKATAR